MRILDVDGTGERRIREERHPIAFDRDIAVLRPVGEDEPHTAVGGDHADARVGVEPSGRSARLHEQRGRSFADVDHADESTDALATRCGPRDERRT